MLICLVLNILLAFLSRFLFAVHGIVTVWYVTHITCQSLYWLLVMGVALMGVEVAITIKWTSNAEWKWFSPMILLYLITVVPSIWVLELQLLEFRQSDHVSNGSCSSKAERLVRQDILKMVKELEPKDKVAALEQTMLIVLVLGRWLMPKGDMSRDQLSQLLMAYIGLGADILDVLEIFKEDGVKKNRGVTIAGLILFSLALTQFPLVLTQTTPEKEEIEPGLSRRQHSPGESLGGVVGSEAPSSCSCTPYCSSEVWSLLLTVVIQDGPFLFYRLYLMIKFQVRNQLMIFFTCKNILVILLEFYRMYAVQCEQGAEPRGADETMHWGGGGEGGRVRMRSEVPTVEGSVRRSGGMSQPSCGDGFHTPGEAKSNTSTHPPAQTTTQRPV